MKFGLIGILLLIQFPILFAQQPSHFFLGKDEFEGVQIYDVIQDKALNYWFATDRGFYKYDGYNFISIECKGLKGQSGFGFVINKKGVIFCHNLNNQILKIEKDRCTVFYELKGKEQASDVFLEITSDNSLLVLTHAVLLFDENGKRQSIPNLPERYYVYPFQTKQGKTISHILDKDSLLLVEGKRVSIVPLRIRSGQIRGVLKFFRIHSKTYAVSTTDKHYYSFDEVDFILESLAGQTLEPNKEYLRFYNENEQLWMAGTVSGVRIITQPGAIEPGELLFPGYQISDVYKDHEGNILLSTFNHGVLVIPNLKIPDVLSIPNDHTIVSLCRDAELGLLMGTMKGQLISYDGKNYKLLCDEGKRPLQGVYSSTGFPYVLFDDGYIKAYHKKTGKVVPVLQSSLKDVAIVDKNTAYFALNTGTYKLTLTGESTFKEEYLMYLKIRSYAVSVEPKTQYVYVATSDGLRIINAHELVKTGVYKGETIFANDIANETDEIFVASKAHGILVFSNGEITRRIVPTLNQRESEVYKIKVIGKKLYINTSEGFAITDLNGKVITQLNKVHGFSANKIVDFDVVGDDLWIVHSKGVQRLNIHQLTSVTPKPLIRISEVRVNDTILKNISGKGEFNSNERKFLFTLSSPTLRNKESIRYHYQLQGYDAEWQIVSYKNNSIIYNALEPGGYTFLVKAENQGVFSEVQSYAFYISTPFYLQWWFLLIIGAATVLEIILIYRWQLKKQRKKAEMVNELNLSKLTAIQSQMNPHFIFNSLNSIQDLVLKGDIDNSYSFITKFSDLIRRTLNYSDKDFIDFDQEIKLIELYLALEKLRFRSELTYSIQTNEIDDIMIPPMLIQPLIENALVHGLLHKEGAKEIKIQFQLKDALVCIIEDNGIGRQRAKEIKTRQRSGYESFSGQAIRKRFSILSEHFKGELGFEYEDLYQNGQPSGTRVTLFIPVKRKY